MNPFGETTDPGVYVPRPATEAALSALVRAVEDRRPAALVGAPGVGKTLLLHQAARRLALFWRSVYVPYASLSADELAAFALGTLGTRADGHAVPTDALLAAARGEAARGRGVLLLVDDAGSLEREAGERLGDLAWRAGGGLGLLLAAVDDAASSRALAALGGELCVVRFGAGLDPDETRAYVRGRLARCGAPPGTADRFDEPTLAWLHRLSGGVPRRLHEIAAELVDRPPEEVASACWTERWRDRPDPESGEAARPVPEPEPELDLGPGPLEHVSLELLEIDPEDGDPENEKPDPPRLLDRFSG